MANPEGLTPLDITLCLEIDEAKLQRSIPAIVREAKKVGNDMKGLSETDPVDMAYAAIMFCADPRKYGINYKTWKATNNSVA